MIWVELSLVVRLEERPLTTLLLIAPSTVAVLVATASCMATAASSMALVEIPTLVLEIPTAPISLIPSTTSMTSTTTVVLISLPHLRSLRYPLRFLPSAAVASRNPTPRRPEMLKQWSKILRS
jgi:hypothetical protein